MRCDKKTIYLLVGITIAFAFYILVEFAVEQHASQQLTNVYNNAEQQERVRGSGDVESRSIDGIETQSSQEQVAEYTKNFLDQYKQDHPVSNPVIAGQIDIMGNAWCCLMWDGVKSEIILISYDVESRKVIEKNITFTKDMFWPEGYPGR